MNKIGIFFGSDTGNTEKTAIAIQDCIGKDKADIHDIANVSQENIQFYDILIFGVPTWYYGELQCDWDDFLPNLKKIDFKKKIIAIFGCGDQEDYTEYFCDAMRDVYNTVIHNGAIIVGKWATKGYNFEKSRALYNKNYFIGLVIDEDRQPQYSTNRIKKWVDQILKEIKNSS
ncbi:flavodoxin FldA [Buchnera aphidicola (Hormaphis cornu)]|nr:flavodoxin FldA [Buchnera aphidicola (Hormaphis cornu)]